MPRIIPVGPLYATETSSWCVTPTTPRGRITGPAIHRRPVTGAHGQLNRARAIWPGRSRPPPSVRISLQQGDGNDQQPGEEQPDDGQEVAAGHQQHAGQKEQGLPAGPHSPSEPQHAEDGEQRADTKPSAGPPYPGRPRARQARILTGRDGARAPHDQDPAMRPQSHGSYPCRSRRCPMHSSVSHTIGVQQITSIGGIRGPKARNPGRGGPEGLVPGAQAGPGAGQEGRGHPRRAAQPGQPAVGLQVPHQVPVRAGAVRRRGATAPLVRPGSHGCLPLPAADPGRLGREHARHDHRLKSRHRQISAAFPCPRAR
jgi:hypothetical protein